MLMAKTIPHYNLYGEHSPVDELEFLHIETIAERNQEYHWEIEAHRHDNLMQLLLIEEGHMQATLDTEQLNCYGPTLVWVPPTIVHGFTSQPGTKGYVLTIAESFFQQTLSEAEREEFPELLHSPVALALDPHDKASSEIPSLIRTIDHEFRWPQSGRVSMISAYIKVLMVHIRRLSTSRGKKTTEPCPQAHTFENFRKLVEHHYKDHWSVQHYAKQLGVTESRLNTLSRKVVDLSPSQVIHNRLIMEAKRNLVYTSMPVSVIAYDLGFKDPAYFSRYFTNQTGDSASQFREKYTH